MYSHKFQELRKQYEQERGTEFTNDHFAALLYTFPSMLIAQADGNIDGNEREFIKDLPTILTKGYKRDGLQKVAGITLTDEYFEEMDYITEHLDAWEDRFLSVLKEQLHNSLNERNAVFQMMWRTADSSDDISQVERERIDQITTKLGL